MGKQNRFALFTLHSSIFNGEKRRGYTLIELTVVIVLIGMMLAIAIPRIRYSLLTDNLKSVTRRMIGIVKEIRNDAVREQKAYFLYLDLASNKVWVESQGMGQEERAMTRQRAFTFPEDVRIMDVWREEHGKQVDGEVVIRFTKKGYVEHTAIHLGAEDGREFTLILSPFLGTIKGYDRYVDIEAM
ncbi:MAG: prepilin-type N-terminal cleavage/methylation domain-containing protein [Deltaproteobacteria bacterium]|nr:prepilin-type N-terminal cleavage/methylation domain-containing protein [Deltaproteobacteria bacterium]MBW2077977.1 prepilin-type N-terminal cleavage/methylation domain-containing protein [Deltaproteobacteria bacterium]